MLLPNEYWQALYCTKSYRDAKEWIKIHIFDLELKDATCVHESPPTISYVNYLYTRGVNRIVFQVTFKEDLSQELMLMFTADNYVTSNS